MSKKKINEALQVLQGLFDRAERKRKVRRKHLKAIIGDLKKREKTLRKRREKEESKSKIKQLTHELDVIQTQRKKGNLLLKDLRKRKKH